MKLAYLSLIIVSAGIFNYSQAQITGSFVVKGNTGTYYPVTFYDGGWDNSMTTELELGRSNVHNDGINGEWRGALIAKIRFHTNNGGHLANFITSDMQTNTYPFTTIVNLIGGYQDITNTNADKKIIVWLKGGTTTYYYKSNYTVTPTVYDGVQNPLPFKASDNVGYTTKTTPDAYINQAGMTFNASVYANTVVVGRTIPAVNTNYLLDVYGSARANKVVVNTTGADFVFDSSYQLISLDSVETFVKQNKHLPEIEPAADMQSNGVDLGSNQTKLLQKIEELTLYLIEQNKKIEALKNEINQLQQALKK